MGVLRLVCARVPAPRRKAGSTCTARVHFCTVQAQPGVLSVEGVFHLSLENCLPTTFPDASQGSTLQAAFLSGPLGLLCLLSRACWASFHCHAGERGGQVGGHCSLSLGFILFGWGSVWLLLPVKCMSPALLKRAGLTVRRRVGMEKNVIRMG